MKKTGLFGVFPRRVFLTEWLCHNDDNDIDEGKKVGVGEGELLPPAPSLSHIFASSLAKKCFPHLFVYQTYFCALCISAPPLFPMKCPSRPRRSRGVQHPPRTPIGTQILLLAIFRITGESKNVLSKTPSGTLCSPGLSECRTVKGPL